MGVTIHYSGQLAGEKEFKALMADAAELAQANGWQFEEFAQEHAELIRVEESQIRESTGPTRGIAIVPHPESEPIFLEFDNKLYMQSFTKTQFAPIEVHVAVAEFLRAISRHFLRFQVVDEAEYYDTGDTSLLESYRKQISDAIARFARNADKIEMPDPNKN